MRFLLDTNVVSDALKERPHPKILKQLALHEGHLAIASVTWHELRFGIERLPRGRRKNALAEAVELWGTAASILDYDARAAEWHARERAGLAAAGRTEQVFDGQIAAVAATRSLTLVTANVKHFKAYEGLTVIDWSR